MSNSPEDIRKEQNSYGRRTLHAVNRSGNDRPRNDGAPFVKREQRKVSRPKGHDAILDELQTSGVQVRVTMMSGESLHGVIKARDKFTITLDVGDHPETIYKHAIESFGISVEALDRAVA